MLCAAIVAAADAASLEQGYPTRIKLICTTTNANALVKTVITEKDIIARCATYNSVAPARLRLLFVAGEVDVVDIVSSNVTCAVATFNEDFPTNVTLFVAVGTNSNVVKAATFTPFNSLDGSLLPTDLSATMVSSYSASMHSNSIVSATLKGTIQGGSVSNNTIYTGTVTIGGKPFALPD
jgi:hypothetical protein